MNWLKHWLQNWRKETHDYRRGFVEGQSGERNIYRLREGVVDLEEYERGFADGKQSVKGDEAYP